MRMAYEVSTPITQAMREGAINRKELKDLMKRSNKPALIRIIIWLSLLSFTCYLIWLSIGSWYLLPAMFIH